MLVLAQIFRDPKTAYRSFYGICAANWIRERGEDSTAFSGSGRPTLELSVAGKVQLTTVVPCAR